MAKKAFNKIMAGLKDMRAHLEGDTTKAKVIARAPALNDIDVTRLRKQLRLSQGQFAEEYKISIGTIQGWEQKRRQPDGPALLLLHAIRKDPQGMKKIIELATR